MAKIKAKIKKLKPKRKKKMDVNCSSVIINGVEYLPKSAVEGVKQFEGPIKIVVLQRGWVLIGKYERKENQCFLHNASVIRNWGTKKGLGELAKDGPQPNTLLDTCNGVVEFEALTQVLCIAVNQDLWKNKL